jgi:hypothetical protein
MGFTIRKKLLCSILLWVLIYVPVFGQAIYVDLNSIPKAGTALIYSHQDDDVIWMLPFWKVTEEFIGGAMPPTPRSRTLVQEQQVYMDNNGYGIDYLNNWKTPWGDISDDEYNQYYWIANPDYDYLQIDHLVTRLGPDMTPLPISELNKLKAKIEQYIASPSVSRIITHNIWGEYGHAHHMAVDKAVRELAVKYRKDVWMLGCDNGNFINVDIPSGITYTTGRFDPVLFSEIETIYKNNYYWTSDDYIPPGDINFIKIVEGGVDRSNAFIDGTVTTPGPYQAEPGAYIFDGEDDYLTLAGNNNSTYTISMRIRPDVIQAMDISKMSEYPSAATCDRSFYLQSDGRVTARVFDTQSRTVTSNSAILAGKWTNILMTGDGNNLKIYINGILEASVAAGFPTVYTSPEFILGQAQETSSYFRGQISNVRLYDHVLTDGEIAVLAHNLTLSGVTANNKVYDGTTHATLNTGGASLVGVYTGDNVSLVSTDAAGSFENKIVGTGKKVITSGFVLSGPDAANYTLSQPEAKADILIASLTVSGVTSVSKVYDGTTSVSLNTSGATLAGVVPGDEVSLVSSSATGTFDNKTVGTDKAVSTTGFTLSGADADKYTLTQPSTTGSITAKSVTVTGLTANNKIYNRNTAATLSGTPALSGILLPDVVTLEGSPLARFSSGNTGTDIIVSVTGFTISGADAGNYTLTQPELKANITAKELTITGITANNKPYDGNTAATISGTAALSGILPPDVVTLGGTPQASFSSRNKGVDIAVNVTGLTISGADADNYTITQPELKANITAKELTITGITAVNKPYDGNTAATLSGTPALSGVLIPDLVVLGGIPVATFASPEVSDNIPVNVTGFNISGADEGNYTLTQPQGLTANIYITTGSETIQSGKLSYWIYPNPASDFIILNIVNYNNEKLSYILFNGSGSIMENKQVTSNKTLIPMTNFVSGAYFIKISGDKNDVKTIKILKK